ncbi:MAG: dihydroxyacetone kinase subunit DhaK [Deltaproteobacteria bacterium]|nr:dihydroxyacetone kinase subunit DhaK [Deltaproteobacteria bacterium]
MKKFINAVDDVVMESLKGFCAAHGDIVVLGDDAKFVRRANPVDGKVALISGGGSGHEPLHAGFVGRGMLDAACPGAVFTSPTPDQMIAAAQAVEREPGCLFIVKNYSGDVMNFEMAAEMFEGQIETVVTNDDVAVEDSTYTTGRRGVAGTMIVEKIVGAAAEKGLDLAQCANLGRQVNDCTRSMGVALTSCTVPAAGAPTFKIGEDEMEMGVGIHGEPGRSRMSMTTAAEISELMISAIMDDLAPQGTQNAIILVNGLGATPLMELYLLYDCARAQLQKRDVRIVRSLVGNYVTSLEMAGCSFTVSIADEDLIKWWDAPVHTAALRWNC